MQHLATTCYKADPGTLRPGRCDQAATPAHSEIGGEDLYSASLQPPTPLFRTGYLVEFRVGVCGNAASPSYAPGQSPGH